MWRCSFDTKYKECLRIRQKLKKLFEQKMILKVSLRRCFSVFCWVWTRVVFCCGRVGVKVLATVLDSFNFFSFLCFLVVLSVFSASAVSLPICCWLWTHSLYERNLGWKWDTFDAYWYFFGTKSDLDIHPRDSQDIRKAS